MSCKYLISRGLFFLFTLFFAVLPASAINTEDDETPADHAEEHGEGFDFGSMVIHHVLDDYQWHWFDSEALGIHATIYFPIIVFHPEDGFAAFSAKKLSHGETYKGYYFDHGKLLHEDGSHSATLLAPTGNVFYDFSITKNVVAMLVSVLLLFFIFISVARAYKRNPGKAPKGLQSFMEPIILFIRDEVVRPTIGPKADRFLPFLMTVFFFIWINNMLGLLPGAANVTGNIAVTLVLAVFTFVVTNFSGNKHYWGHIFAPPGLPGWLLPIMWVVEILSLVIKPLALAIRLFANINAGHMIILSIIGLIFVFGEIQAGLGFGVSIVSIAFTLFMYFLELLVAAVQAYIFTILSAVFIAQAVEEEHHESEGFEEGHAHGHL